MLECFSFLPWSSEKNANTSGGETLLPPPTGTGYPKGLGLASYARITQETIEMFRATTNMNVMCGFKGL